MKFLATNVIKDLFPRISELKVPIWLFQKKFSLNFKIIVMHLLLWKSVPSLKISHGQVFFSTPVAPNEGNVVHLEKGMGQAACDVCSGRKFCFDKAMWLKVKGFCK